MCKSFKDPQVSRRIFSLGRMRRMTQTIPAVFLAHATGRRLLPGSIPIKVDVTLIYEINFLLLSLNSNFGLYSREWVAHHMYHLDDLRVSISLARLLLPLLLR